jgi:acetyl-CoA carboxylase biotin carboxyl carrier protein
MDIKEIKAVLDLCKKQDVAEFELKTKDFEIKLKRGNDTGGGVPAQEVVNVPALAPAVVPAAAAAPAPAAAPEGPMIKAPMIGTFYRAPSPESANYVEVGDKVTADSVVCIIEAMKVMNEIKAEVSGTIAEILVDNSKPVEFDQPLFRINPA